MIPIMKRLISKIEGQAVVEYGFILLLIAMALFGALLLLGEGVIDFFQTLRDMLPIL